MMMTLDNHINHLHLCNIAQLHVIMAMTVMMMMMMLMLMLIDDDSHGADAAGI